MSYAPAVKVHPRTAFVSVLLLAFTLILVPAAQAHRKCPHRPAWHAPTCSPAERSPTVVTPTESSPVDVAPTDTPEEPSPTDTPEEPSPTEPSPTDAPEEPSPAAITTWRGPGSSPLSDSEAASRVTSGPENRWDNYSANHYSPSHEELEAFRSGQRDQYGRNAVAYNPLARHVTGGFQGTTDEILQWAAHKWGIPEDVVRAVAVGESWWRMSQLGDPRDGLDASAYPGQSRIDGDSAYQSLGIMQIKWTPEGLHTGTEPLRWKSTAFNVDYWAATVRYYFDGYCDWCYPRYVAGQEWESIAAWCCPSPWKEHMDAYISYIKGHLWDRTWETPSFR